MHPKPLVPPLRPAHAHKPAHLDELVQKPLPPVDPPAGSVALRTPIGLEYMQFPRDVNPNDPVELYKAIKEWQEIGRVLRDGYLKVADRVPFNWA
jgi:hypothetical protein